MIGLTLLAVLAAIGHHLFYVYLDGKQVSQVKIPQAWVIRVGTAFAYLFKASLVAAVGIAFCQRFWYSARRSSLQIRSLDAMFGVLINPLKFFNADLLLRTKVLFIMAVIAWILPIAAIFSPGAMTGFHRVRSVVISSPATQISMYPVPTLTLDRDIGILQLGTASFFFGGSVGFRRFILSVMSGGEIIPWPSPCGANCTYSVSFQGPALSCVAGDPNGPNVPIVQDNTFYNASSANPGEPDDINGNGPSGLLIALLNTTTPIVHNCTLYDSTYNITVQYNNNLQTVGWETVLDDVVPSSIWQAFNNHIYDATNGTSDGIPVSEWWYRLNEYTIGYAFFDFLYGYLLPEPDGAYTIDTDIVFSNLVNLSAFYDLGLPPDLDVQIESLFANMTISMLGFTQNPIFVGAFGEKSQPAAIYTQVEATVTSDIPRYSYSRLLLWALYGAALAIGLFLNIVGGVALMENGVDGDTSFSQVLVTTRSPDFDQLCAESTHGGYRIAEDLIKTRVRFVTDESELKAKFEIMH